MLTDIAGALKGSFRGEDIVARIGGDEFCVLFREPEKEKYCREKFYWIIEKRKKSLHMLPGASYGSALIEEQESISDTKARADANMYADKKARKQIK